MKRPSLESIEIFERFRVPRTPSRNGQYSFISMKSMRFAGPKVGWAVGGGKVLTTIDGGYRWKVRHLSGPVARYTGHEAACPIDAQRCALLVGLGSDEVGCFLTSDGGETWKAIFRCRDTPYLNLYGDVLFADPHCGWVLTGAVHKEQVKAVLHRTEDGGVTWTSNDLGLRGAPTRLVFSGASEGWLLETVERGRWKKRLVRVHYTNDGGQEWRSLSTMRGDAVDIYAAGGGTLFLTGWNGLFARSADGGRNWSRILPRSSFCISSVHLKGPTGLAVGTKPRVRTSEDILLLVSHDRGASWRRLESPVAMPLWDVYLTAWDRGVLTHTEGILQFRLLATPLGNQTEVSLTSSIANTTTRAAGHPRIRPGSAR